MMALLITGLLWVVPAALALTAAVQSRLIFRAGMRSGVVEFLRMTPRLAIGVIGSGYIAAALPQDMVTQWLGPNSGALGVAAAAIAGALTPGGPVVGFSIGAAALKGGAGAPQVIAYSTAWALFALPRLVSWELPMMPPRVVWLRILVSLPIPLLAALGASMLGRP
jgi:uncharacterized membrane protein YraQ (UPF0718 family)